MIVLAILSHRQNMFQLLTKSQHVRNMRIHSSEAKVTTPVEKKVVSLESLPPEFVKHVRMVYGRSIEHSVVKTLTKVH